MEDITEFNNKLQEKNYTYDDIIKIRKAYTKKVISIPPIYVAITGSLSAAYLLSQIAWLSDYWEKHTGSRIFYRRDIEFQQEMNIKEREFRTAKKKLIEMGLIDVVLKGAPPLSYYELNDKKLTDLILSHIDDDDMENDEEEDKVDKILSNPVKSIWTNRPNRNGRIVQNLPYIEREYIKENDINPYIPLKSNSKSVKSEQPSSLSLLETKQKQKSKKKYEEEFLQFWKEYPKSKDKPKTYEEYCKARKEGAEHEDIMLGVKNYAMSLKISKTEDKYIQHSSRWLKGNRWEDEYKTDNLTDTQKEILFRETGDPQFESDASRIRNMFRNNS